MLAQFRRFLNTRAARLFFVVLIIPFVMWGVADVARNIGQDTALAKVGDRKIELPEFQEAFRRQVAEVTRMMGGKIDPTPAIRRGIAGQTLERLVIQAAIADEVSRLGLSAPDEAVRQAVFDIPAFRGLSGAFDRRQFDSVLRQNNLTEPRFLDLMRSDLGQRQLMEAVQVGIAAPDVLLGQVFAFQRETRVAETVELPWSAAPEPPTPTAEELRQAWQDDPARYSAPAFRRIKAVVLSPETLARDIDVPEADIAAYYQQHPAEFGTAEKRSLQVVVAQDEAAAQKLALQWRAGADWDAMQKAAAEAGASSVPLDDTARDGLPSAEAATAAFAAEQGAVAGPVKTEFGYQVIRVIKVTPGVERPLEAVRDDIHLKLARERAVDQVYGRANKLEDALSATGSLDSLPADLGVAAIAGTLDAAGNTKDGEPAPIPGTPALRQAIISAAFAAPLNDPARMVEGPDQSYYAFTIEDETPPAVKPFETVQDQVRENWIHDARRKSQEAVAAKLLAAVRAGGSLDDAAVVAGLRTDRTPPIGRSAPTEGVARELVEPLFALKKDEATMIETPSGFIVAKLVEASSPDLAADPLGAGQMRTALAKSVAQDAEITFAAALRDRAKPTVNRTLLDSVSQ